MLVFLQFTLSDLRPFTDGSSDMLIKPNWPDPDIDGDFVRNAGSIIERKGQGVGSWVGEGRICKLGKGISIKRNKISSKISIRNFSKHCYTSGQKVLTKYEFVFSVSGGPKAISSGFIHAVADAIFKSEVQLKSGKKHYVHYVYELARVLKRFHIEATTLFGKHTDVKLLDYVLHSSPQLYFYLDLDEQLELGFRDFKLISETHFNLWGSWRRIENQMVRFWLHERLTVSSLINENRNTRITIMRIHSEFECLRNIFKAISLRLLNVTPFSNASNSLQEYFNISISTFLKEKRELQGNTENFFDYFSQLTAKFRPGELTTIVNQIKAFNFRRQIEDKTLNYINIEELIMGNKNIFGDNVNVGAIGNNNNLQNLEQTVNVGAFKDEDYTALVVEIQNLKNTMIEQNVSSPSVTQILTDAEIAVANKNDKNILESLKKGGLWLFDFAGRVGSTLVAAILKDQLKL